MITKNEQPNIERCLASVQWAEEILVVDTESTDQTVTLARKSGARVVQKEWLGYGPQKAFAAKEAKFDWILSIDADEAVGAELALEIQQRFVSLNPTTAYKIPRRSWFMGRWIRHGGWYPDWQIRLFNRKHSMWDNAQIHESVKSQRVAQLENDLLHYVFKDISHQINTNNRYSSLLAEKDFSSGKRFALHRVVVKPFVKFVECYIVKQGCRDGLPGFAIAIGAAYSVFLRWIKIWELGQAKKGSS